MRYHLFKSIGFFFLLSTSAHAGILEKKEFFPNTLASLSKTSKLLGTSTPQKHSPTQQYNEILTHKRIAMGTLLAWSGLSIASGALLLATQSSTFWQGFAIQSLGWGVIDATIGILSLLWMKANLHSAEEAQKERTSFRQVMLINTALDVLYILVGVGLVIWGNQNLQGHGYGVIVQGGFLFLFDGLNAILTF